MCGGGPSTPKPPAIAPVLPEAPQASGRVEVTKNSDDDRRRRSGHAGTILTGPRGLTSDTGASQSKSLLGA